MPVFCELDRATVDEQRAAVLVAELIVWWFQAGRHFYDVGARQQDDGLRGFVEDAIVTLGGWKAARRLLRSADASPSGVGG